MKQHITPKQAMETTKEQFYSLIPELVDRNDWSDYHHKKLTIGKMIEILKEKYEEIKISNEGYSDNVWSVSVDMGFIFTMGEELCDALWDVVKSMLSN